MEYHTFTPMAGGGALRHATCDRLVSAEGSTLPSYLFLLLCTFIYSLKQINDDDDNDDDDI